MRLLYVSLCSNVFNWLHMNQGVFSHVLQEEVQLRVAAGVHRDLKQRHEDVLQHLLEVAQLLVGVIDVTVGGVGGTLRACFHIFCLMQ